jgi:bacillithiol biosynthesis cysteine-adding enzyme BshC
VYSDCLPFTQIPHTTRVFSDFLYHFDRVQQFYSRPPLTTTWAAEAVAGLAYEKARRERMASVLKRQNAAWGASSQTMANIERLRAGSAAVVTGQQVGLFGGPAFATYKALTATKVAAEFTRAGADSVPIFWLATEDHDFAEVSSVDFPVPDGQLQRIGISSAAPPETPVGQIALGEQIVAAMQALRELLGDNAITAAIADCYKPGETLGSAFAKLLLHNFARFGLIVLDPSDPEVHQIASPILESAVTRAAELNVALQARDKELETAGYHQQVKVTKTSTLLFQIKDGIRTPIHLEHESFAVGQQSFSASELARRVAEAPQEFSPNVLLRPVMQDYLLPTVADIAGPSEIAYLAQVSAIYPTLLGRVSAVLPRFSATVLEPRASRLLERYRVQLTDLFTGPEQTRALLAARSLPDELEPLFAAAGAGIDNSMASITAALDKIDHTLVDAAGGASAKMRYQLEQLHRRAAQAHLRRTQEVATHADQLSTMLYPHKMLQERVIPGAYFLARHGPELLDQLYETMQLTCPDHQIVKL